MTGKKPYDLTGLTTLEALKTVCEWDPERPSSVADGASRRALGGDLDNIVMKCLRKEPGERYPSVRALADDLRAWDQGWPVSASARTQRYQAGKLFRRYKLQVVAAALVLLATVSGGVATAWEAHVARQERDRAQNRFRQVREFSRSLLFEVHESLRKLPGATQPRQLLLTRAIQFSMACKRTRRTTPPWNWNWRKGTANSGMCRVQATARTSVTGRGPSPASTRRRRSARR